MIAQPTVRDVETFRAVIARRLGLNFDDTKLGFLAEILQRRADKLRQSGEAYLYGLEREPSASEYAALAQELTVTETYFFRHNEQFRALAEIVVPERMRARETFKTLRFLSAGCASGEEPYTLAIVARDAVSDPAWTVAIRAVDLNPAALEKARRGRYSAWALRETPQAIQQTWFRPDGRDMILDESVRADVTFESRNLAAGDPALWLPETYDAIFCRNVLMYFTPEQMRAVIADIARSLVPGGFLFLGHAETLRGVSDDFHLRHTHETFYYERKTGSVAIAPRPPQATHRILWSAAPAADSTWYEVIRNATERVASLMPDKSAQPPLGGSVGHPSGRSASPPAWNMAQALDLLHRERYAEALAYVRDGPSAANKNPGVLLLEATLLAHSGQFEAAEETSNRLLQADELDAGAYYVLALCREGMGDLDGAAEHDRTAMYLDPAFAMPRLHLGLMARRRGDRDTARRELQHALILLESEIASRLLLFGGGFNRRALIDLCTSALQDCRERS